MQESQSKQGYFEWVVTLMISFTITLLSLLTYDTYFAQKILTIDLKGFTEAQRKLFLSGLIDDETLKTNIDLLQQKIQSVPKNTTILIKEVVVNDTETIAP